MGRKKKIIDWEEVKVRLKAGNSGRQIAHDLGMDKNTFLSRFQEEFGERFIDYKDRELNAGNANLQLKQYLLAMKGNVQMLLMLGKERLGQGKQEVLVSPYQKDIDLEHKLMIIEAENAKLKEKLGNQCKTEQELCGSDP